MVAFGFGLLSGILLFVILRGTIRTPASGHVLICRSNRGVDVERSTRFVWPVLERCEEMAVHDVPLVVERRGRGGVSLSDGCRVDVRIVASIGVGDSDEDVLRVADSTGVHRALAAETLDARFAPRLLAALDDVMKQYALDDVFDARQNIENAILGAFESDLGGYRLARVAIESWRRTAVEDLDPSHPDDARGITKLTSLAHEARGRAAEAAKQAAHFELEAARAKAEAELEAARAQADAERAIAIAKAQADADIAAAQVEVEVARAKRRGANRD